MWDNGTELNPHGVSRSTTQSLWVRIGWTSSFIPVVLSYCLLSRTNLACLTYCGDKCFHLDLLYSSIDNRASCVPDASGPQKDTVMSPWKLLSGVFVSTLARETTDTYHRPSEDTFKLHGFLGLGKGADLPS